MKDTYKRDTTSAERVSTFGGFVAGAIAACGAVTFTNPIELVKTRMQLQGELQKGSNTTRLYKNPLQAFALIYKNEGIRGLQQGLICGYLYQMGLNGSRIGFYEPSRAIITKLIFPQRVEEGKPIPQILPINVVSGFISGSIGAVMASPFFLVKTRMQSYSGASETLKVGDQTYYKNAWDGLKKIYTTEGAKGLFRGIDSAIIRTGTGSSAQLPIYNLCKDFMIKNNVMSKDSSAFTLVCSSIAGVGVSIVLNPWDVVLTRIYNQNSDHYKGPIDCLTKTVRYEGFGALYKGFYAQLLRMCPHTILCLTFMEYTMPLIETIENKLAA